MKQDREVPDSGKVPTIRPFDIEIGPFDLDSSGRTAAVWWWNPKTDPFMESLKPDAAQGQHGADDPHTQIGDTAPTTTSLK